MPARRIWLLLLFGLGIITPTTGTAGEPRVARATASTTSLPAANFEMPVRKQYEILVRFVRTLPDGKEVPGANPRLVIMEGTPGFVAIGGEVSPPKGVEIAEPLRVGLRFSARVFRKGEQLFLDATADLSKPTQDSADCVRVASTGLRVIEAITLGKTIVVSMSQGKGDRWEVVVREPEPWTSVGAGDIRDRPTQ